MNRSQIILAVSVLLLLVIGMFTYTFLAKSTPAPVTVPAPDNVEVPTGFVPERIEATHFYQNGVHTIVGELDMPTPCDLLTYDSVVAESMPEQVTFNFGVINNSEACAQVVTTQRFMVSATASPAALLKATFRNMPVTLNLREAAPGETPESFELYIKG